MQQRVGTCSLCGGDVMGFRGAWLAVIPPPPDECAQCGARRADDVIEMKGRSGRWFEQYHTTTTTTDYT